MAIPEEEIDDRGYMGRTCFVVMPFGLKIDTGKLAAVAVEASSAGMETVQLLPGADVPVIDFDAIYRKLIEPAVEKAAKNVGLEIECIRSDKAGHSGFIHREMLEHVAGADIAIVDITTQNANVFYELGVRHSFRRSTTILIQRLGTHIPFNISGMRVLPYSDDEVLDESGNNPLQASVQKLADMIAASTRQKENDSLVHHLLPGTSVVRESWPIMEQRYVRYDVLDRDRKPIVVRKDSSGQDIRKSVGFITGDILHIDNIDVWVNPENTKMQMARYHDGSISSNIRYYGAERNDSGQVVEDTISRALEQRMSGASSVEPGVVFPTVPGALGRTNGVKLILHVAAMQGEPGKGYQPIRDYPGCVRRVLVTVDRLNSLPPAEPKRGGWRRSNPAPAPGTELHGLGCKTVIFPLFGTRSFGRHPQTVAEDLFRAAVVFLEQLKSSLIERVYFLAHTEQDRELCERALGLLQSKKRIIQSGNTE